MIFEAIEFAAQAHHGQYRKGTRIPYITHPLNVANILLEYGYPEQLAVAGVLHDTVEDTPVTLAEIRSLFGERVVRLVAGASEPDKAGSWDKRKQHTIDHLKTAPVDVVVLACADKLDNVRSLRRDYLKLGEALWARFNRPKERQHWYYQSLAQVFITRVEDERMQSLFDVFQDEVYKVF